MKFCQVTSAFHRNDTRIFYKQGQAMKELGFEVYFIANDGKPSEIKEGVHIVSSGLEARGRLKRILLSGRRILSIALDIDADIYMIHDPELINVGLSLLRRGKKVLYDAHENFPKQLLEKEWLPAPLRRLFSWLAEVYFKFSLPRFSYITTVTPDIGTELRKYSDRVAVMCNFPILDQSEAKVSIDDYVAKPDRICYSGTVYTSSNQELILDALADVAGVQYSMVGTIDHGYKAELALKAAWERVSFVDRVDRSELLRYYRESTIGVVILDYSPNLGGRKGSLGVNKIFEYMAMGLPIICTDFDLWKDIVDRYRCGICVNPNSREEILDAIKTLVTDKRAAYEMGQNGRAAVEREFNWDTQKTAFVSAVKSLISP